MADKPYHALTDEEWKRVEKLLPTTKKTGRPQIDSRAALNASGAPWRFLPAKYGKWTGAGVFTTLTKNESESGDFLAMDSTFCKVHRHALGACKKSSDHETKQEIAPSQGGKTTKIHILLDENFHLLSAGNVNDNLVAPALLQGINLKKTGGNLFGRHFLRCLRYRA